ncbi:MAG: GAF domain-containing sensor histidine kinase, partial [Candidatus Promineifilaceae bacterium]|nr:GAF domain-containing sensor histidine kinase [Candidatus Promineifilaceae bacterium]
SNARQKQQTKWVVWGIAVASIGTVIAHYFFRTGSAEMTLMADLMVNPLTRLLQLAFPITLALAIWRQRLWDIDLVINRTLVYGTLTAVVAGLYVLLVGGLGALFQAQGNLLIALLATGVVAVVFQPLRQRLQRGVNRLMYGERDDPFAALAALGRRLEVAAAPEAVLPVIAETVTQTLRVPYAAVVLQTGEEAPVIVAEAGQSVGETVSYPMRYQADDVGALLVAPRAPGEPFSPADERLLRNLARQGGAAVQAVRLTLQLRRSRQRIVAAREEERRRLRRDLHDGLGPQLASQTLGLQAVARLMKEDPDKAQQLLTALQGQAQEAILDVRRLVYNLRPPALDELGLSGALRESVHRLETVVRFTFDGPARLPELPAAVEVATYRIAQEAMTNVVRHAEAQRCTVRLALEANSLVAEISDDGRGLPADFQAGVGLRSMRERAAELNGRCQVQSLPEGGVRVRAVFPLEE